MADLWKEVERALAPFERMSRIADLQAELRQVSQDGSRRCGNCFWWMKSNDCPQERNVNGYSRGPNCNSSRAITCNKYEQTQRSRGLFESRMGELKQKADALGVDIGWPPREDVKP